MLGVVALQDEEDIAKLTESLSSLAASRHACLVDCEVGCGLKSWSLIASKKF